MILKDFRTSLEEVINNSGLSIDMIYFVMKDLMNEINEIYIEQISKEQMDKVKSLEKENNEIEREED